jgi:hypothetical protein
MYPDVAPFDSNPLYSEYSPLGRNYGHPGVNTVMRMMFGQNYMPSPTGGQSMYDAMLQRNRSTEFMNLQRSGLVNNTFANRVGLGGNPILAMMGSSASPDSMLSRAISPFVGGNPMAAQMQLSSGLAGGGVMGNFGRMSPISSGESEDMMQSLEKRFYRTQAYEGIGGVREDINAQGKEAIRGIAKTSNRKEIFKNLGLGGLVDDKGNLSAGYEDFVNNFNIADDTETSKKIDLDTMARKAQSSNFSSQLNSLLKK